MCDLLLGMSAGDQRNLSGNDRYKRLFDLTALLCVYLAFLPIWALVWSMIPLLIFLEDRGPAFYRQERLGKHGKPFLMVKFRTMVRDADRKGPLVTAVNDSRLTRVGRYLRLSHLDECPQVLNILRGEMSIVGPRPAPAQDYECDDLGISGFSRRLAALPGITGLAQVRVDAWATQRDKLRYDLLYIRNMGPWLDLKLIAMSVPVVLQGGPRAAGSGQGHSSASDTEAGRPVPESEVPAGPGK